LTEEKREMKFVAYVGNEGRMTVPRGVRDALGIKEGDLLEFTVRKVKPQGAK
jgi:AbrB family looped-hinge helix DNA binding protein